MDEFLAAHRDSVRSVMKDGEVREVTSISIAASVSSSTTSGSTSNGFDTFADSRSIVRLFQCPICFRMFDKPVALPCGNSLCSSCLPDLHERQYISYPNTPDRLQGFICPFDDCAKEHAVGDFGIDVTLKKVMEVWNAELNRFLSFEESVAVEEGLDGNYSDKDSRDLKSAVTHNEGSLVPTYSFTSDGPLSVNTEPNSRSTSGEDMSFLDPTFLNSLKEKLRSELQCLVCYSMYLNPVTTGCGHTLCRGCLERVLDHSPMCPICRKLQNITTTFLQFTPSNRRLTEVLTALFADDVAQRALLTCLEEKVGGLDGEISTPLFICTLSFPAMPTFLHIFEPRYRLMIRRAWQGDKRFGMVLPNRTGQPQGDLGNAPFLEFGTLLEIKTYQLLPDGRSWIETVGISKFRVKGYSYRDAYIIANLETVEDIPIVEEELIEAQETSPNTQFTGIQPPSWALQSTQQLFQIGKNFITKMRIQSAPWLSQQAINVYGAPPEDAAIFPYWLAIVLPIAEEEQYRLLSCNSVRGRLKITVGWIKRIEDQQRNQPSPSSCAVI